MRRPLRAPPGRSRCTASKRIPREVTDWLAEKYRGGLAPCLDGSVIFNAVALAFFSPQSTFDEAFRGAELIDLARRRDAKKKRCKAGK